MNLYALLFALLITILVFFLFRELFCWYWKINRSIELQENILKELQKINNPESNGKSSVSCPLKPKRFCPLVLK